MFHLQVHFHADQTHFHMKSFARRLVLRQRQTRTRKWAICLILSVSFSFFFFFLFLVGSSAVDSSPVKPPPASDWSTEFSDAEETLVNSASESEPDTSQPAPTFFRSFIFSPEVPIRLDYQGKRVDMEQVKILCCLGRSVEVKEIMCRMSKNQDHKALKI